MEKAAKVCSLETYLVQDTNESDEVITITDARHTQRRSERKIDPVLYGEISLSPATAPRRQNT